MSWTEPDDPWGRLQRRRIVFGVALPATALLSIIGMNLALALFMPAMRDLLRTALEPPRLFLVLLVLAVLCLPAARTAWLEWQVFRRVPRHDGAICVRCRRPLPVPPGGDAAARVACTGCGTRQSVTQARDAWATYPTRPSRAGRASLVEDDGGDAAATPSVRTRLVSEHDRPVVLAVALPILLFSGLIAAAVLIRGQSILGTFFDQLPWILLTSGMMLIGAGSGVRRGRTRHCRRCTYQMPPSGAPEHCPECGAAWTKPGAFVQGTSIRRPGVIIVGAVLLLLAFTQIFGGQTARMSIQPTGVIVDAIITETGWDHPNWTALQSRTLTAAQDARLADGVLDLLEDSQYLTVDGHAWLQQRMADGEATPAQVARYVRDSLTVTAIRAPDALAGTPLALALELQRPPRLQLSVAGTWAVYVGDVVLVGPDGTRVSAATTPATAAWPAFRRVRSVDTARPTDRGDTTTPVRIDVGGPVPSVAGRHRVRIEFWRAILPWGSTAVPVTRDAAGAVIVPPGVRWAERMVVEQDVEIAPADRP